MVRQEEVSQEGGLRKLNQSRDEALPSSHHSDGRPTRDYKYLAYVFYVLEVVCLRGSTDGLLMSAHDLIQ